MSVTVTFECDGCHKSGGSARLSRTFQSLSGKGYGFGHYHFDKPEDKVPEGWVAFDPYTGCCYCPDCWASIEAA